MCRWGQSRQRESEMTIFTYVEATAMSWRMIWMPTVFLLFPIAAVTVFLFLHLRNRVQRHYKALADRFDLRFKSTRSLRFPCVEGRFHGRRTRFWQDWITARTLRAEVAVTLTEQLDGEISICHYKRIAPAMRAERIKTGLRAFDRTYVVNASSPEVVQRVLTPQVMDAFGHWVPILRKAARIGGVQLSGRTLRYGDELGIYSRPRREQFEHALGMLTDLAALLEPLLVSRITTPIDSMSVADRAELVGSKGSKRVLRASDD